MPLSFIPDLSNATTSQLLIYIIAGLGIIILAYSVFLEQAHRKDLVQLIGACCLLAYALYQGQKVFALAMGGVALFSIIEFAEIFLGLHHHAQDDLKKYKKMWRNKIK